MALSHQTFYIPVHTVHLLSLCLLSCATLMTARRLVPKPAATAQNEYER